MREPQAAAAVVAAMTYAIHGELTADGERIVLVAAGAPEDVAYAAKLLELVTPLVRKTKPAGALELPATWAAAVQLAATFGDAWISGPRLAEWIADQARARTKLGPELVVGGVAARAGLTPRPYQVDGARLIAQTGRTLLMDEAGSGKTITAILGLTQRAALVGGAEPDRERALPVLVVCPASVVDPWVEAWGAWYPAWRAVAWRGTPVQRWELTGTADVYVVSYDTARRDTGPRDTGGVKAGALTKLAPRSLVIDECHLIKTPTAERSKAVRRLARQAEVVVALSGTPITHHPGDLWPTLAAIEPGAWPSRDRWISRYCLTIAADYGGDQVLGLAPHSEAELRTALLGQHRRVAKADVLDQLPPKVHSVRSVELPPAYRKAYDEFERDMLAELPDDGGELSVMNVLSKFTHLAALASAGGDVEITRGPDVDELTGEPKRHVSITLRAPSWKVDALLEVLDERPGEPVVAFAPSRQLIVLAGEAAAKAGHKVGYVIGGQSARERTDTIDAFQRGELDVLAATTGAGGVGLTLTAARTCVFLARPWSYVEATQAEDRLHRIGAEKHSAIEVIDIVAKNTIDTRVRTALRGKARQLADLVKDPRIVSELLGGSSKIKKEAA